MRRVSICFFGLFLAGCGGGGPGALPPTQTLKVTLDGKPGARLNLQLVSDAGPAGSGATAEDGRATVRGKDDKPLPPGTYKVVVTDAGDTEENPMAPAKKIVSRVPSLYANRNSTPASVTIEAGKMEYAVEVKTSK